MEGNILKDLNGIVANNLKRIREEMKLSLEKLAELTGVSKAMLRQIETGESSPTINTIWKIASGLKIPYTAIMSMPQPDTLVVTKEDAPSQIDDEGKYKVYSIFPLEEGRRFEIYMTEIEKGSLYCASAHGERTQEFITVFDGEVVMTVGEEEYRLKAGDSMRFKADRMHAYHNVSDKLARISMVIYYSI